MPRALELTWVNSLRQWRKRQKVGGKTKTFYLGTGKGKGDREGYFRAMAKWEGIKAKLADEKRQIASMEESEKLRKAFAHLPPYIPPPPDPNPVIEEHPRWAAETRAWEEALKNRKMGMLAMIDAYLVDQRQRYEHGLKFPNAPQKDRISSGRYIAYSYAVKAIKSVWGDVELPKDEAGLYGLAKQFRTRQQEMLTNGAIKANTYNERVKTLRHFLGWLYRNYHINALPRELDGLCSQYSVQSSARALDLDLIRRIWNAADTRFKCYMALALNCGFYAIDIATLPREAIKEGYIEVNRHKTGVPTRFKLWPITQTLIALHVAKDGPLAFVSPEGGPLLVNNPDAGSKRQSKIDNILTYIKRRLELTKVSFSNFRDTSSTKMESIDRSLTDIFNGHKDRRMARFYLDHDRMDAKELFRPLDQAIDALEQWYGLTL